MLKQNNDNLFTIAEGNGSASVKMPTAQELYQASLRLNLRQPELVGPAPPTAPWRRPSRQDSSSTSRTLAAAAAPPPPPPPPAPPAPPAPSGPPSTNPRWRHPVFALSLNIFDDIWCGWLEKEPSAAVAKRLETLKKTPRKRPDWANMMKEIEEGKPLRHVQTNDRSQPILPKVKTKGKVHHGQTLPTWSDDQTDGELTTVVNDRGSIHQNPSLRFSWLRFLFLMNTLLDDGDVPSLPCYCSMFIVWLGVGGAL